LDKEFLNIKKSIEQGSFAPVYLLCGEDQFYSNTLVHLLQEKVLTVSEKSFNEFVLYANETPAGSVVDQARQYPMMAERRLIVYKNVQQADQLEVLAKQNAIVFTPKRLFENQVPAWVKEYILMKDRNIDEEACLILSEYIGTDLSKLSTEIEKLLTNIPLKGRISSSEIYEFVGISREFNVFELNKALGLKKFEKAYLISKYLMENVKNNDPIFLTAAIFSYFQKAMIFHAYKSKSQSVLLKKMGLSSPFFLREYQIVGRNYSVPALRKIFKFLADADLKLKGLGQDKLPREEIFFQLILSILQS
jgi:DNA polymerase-3 subunit delta